MNLPSIVKKEHLTCHWYYRNESGVVTALVTRYDNASQAKQKKWFHQYHLDQDGNWVEGAVTPSPLFGIETLLKDDSDEMVYIFEGEKCAQAAQYLGLLALTSMMGSNQSHLADWAILARYRHHKGFVLVPDNDPSGRKYMNLVCNEIKKACPFAKIWVLILPDTGKGADFVDWIQSNPFCPSKWNGFDPIDEPHSLYLRERFKAYSSSRLKEADIYFDSQENILLFEGNPEPIQEYSMREVMTCPMETLPAEVRGWIQCLINQMQILPDYIAASLFVQLGTVIGRKRALRMRNGTNWIEFPNLWGMLIGVSSSMKSVAMQETIKPVEILAERARRKYCEALNRFKAEQELWEVRKKIDLDGYKDAYKNKKPSTEHQLGTSPEKPKQKRYKTNDATIEKLGILLSENPQGMLIYRDELSGWLNSFRKQGRENDRQFYLESWSGKQRFDSDRIGREIPHIEALCTSILGTIQPGLIEPYIQATIKGKTGDDGFIQRFQIMVWPDMKPDWEINNDANVDVWEPYIHQIFQFLDELDFYDGQPILLSFSSDAQLLFDDWQKTLETKLRKEMLAPHIEAHLGKSKKLLAALCLILEHIEAAFHHQTPSKITAECLKKALIWLKYFESHTYRVYGSSVNAVPQAALKLIKLIQRDKVKVPFTARDVYHGHHWAGLSTDDEVKEALAFLLEKNYIKELIIDTGGRKTTKYWVHPKVLEQDHE